MRSYEVVSRAARLASGRLKLTPQQGRDRAHALREVGKGVYELTAAVEFKRGECFEWDGEPGKGNTDLVARERKARSESATLV